ncbi:MAG: S8 family serine peptidase, partial [Planctomycetota bacterium]
YGDIGDAVEAFHYAVDNGADVVSNSWGGDEYSGTAEEAINYAYSQGVIMVASAGNDDTDEPHYPAYYNHMISVAATDSQDQRAPFSNFGEWVDIAAPGVDVLSLRASGTSVGTTYDEYTTIASGTSMACPHVAAACVVLLSIYPEISVDEAKDILQNEADPIAPGICQSGRLNVHEAIMHMVIPKGLVRLDRKTYPCSGVLTIEVSDLHLKGAGIQNVTVTTDGGDAETLNLTEIDANTGIFEGGIELSVDATVIEDGALQISHGQVITATYHDANDGTGNPATATDIADVDCEPPVVSNVRIGLPGCLPKVTFETDEPTRAYVLWGPSCAEANAVQGSYSGLSTIHAARLSGVSPETDYFFMIEATDAGGNTTVDNNSGQCYAFTTTGPGDIFVPADEPTIQEGIDNSWDGGTVWVADGTYTGTGNRDISFRGKAIVVRSENGPNDCVVDCQASSTSRHRGFNFINSESPASVLDGFTIKNGYGPLQYLTGGRLSSMGGAIFCQGSSPTIANCIIRNNTAYMERPGAWPLGFGGGFCAYNWDGGSPTLTNCIFSDNYSAYGGGGMYCWWYCSPALTNCTFSNNSAGMNGGGLYTEGFCRPTLTDCVFVGNLGPAGTGGISSNNSSPTLTNCVFRDNGGVMRNYTSNSRLTNCIFMDNSGGGALYVADDTNIKLTNCTFAPSETAGYAIILDSYGPAAQSELQITNSILWHGEDQILNEDGSAVTITYSDVKGGWSGQGNIDADPVFVDAVGGDYHLLGGSPAIDAGDPTSDCGNEPWPNGFRVNMGAYGNTAEGATSPVGFDDLAILATHWLTDEPLVDIAPQPDGDGIANFLDFAVLADYWLRLP